MDRNCPETPEMGFDCYSALGALMDAVALLSGAEEPSNYRLDWPFTKEQVGDDPYLRLRTGPTFADLEHLLLKIVERRGGKINPTKLRETISVLLDTTIDEGGIVPTFAHDQGYAYRIYRRGEAHPGREAICRQVLYAWANSRKALSLTRATKILAVLSMSNEFAPLLSADAQLRGYVATLPNSALDADQCEVTFLLRATGRLKTYEG